MYAKVLLIVPFGPGCAAPAPSVPDSAYAVLRWWPGCREEPPGSQNHRCKARGVQHLGVPVQQLGECDKSIRLNVFWIWGISPVCYVIYHLSEQEQAQSICKVLSASFDCALTSDKSWEQDGSWDLSRWEMKQTTKPATVNQKIPKKFKSFPFCPTLLCFL